MMVKQLCAVGLSSAPAYPWISIWLSQQGPRGHSKAPGSAFGRCWTKVDFKRALDFLWETILVRQLLLAVDLPATPAHHRSPSPWAWPFRWAWLGCGFLPCQSSGLQSARLLGTCLLLPPMRSLWQAGKLQIRCCFPRHAGELLRSPGWGALAWDVISGVQDHG